MSCTFTTIDQWIHYYLDSFCERDSDRRQSLSRRSSGLTAVAEACTAVPQHWQNNSRHHSTEYWCHKLWSMPGELVQSSIERLERLCSFEQSNACSQLVTTIIFICHYINKIYVTGINETIKRLIICQSILILWFVQSFTKTRCTTLQPHVITVSPSIQKTVSNRFYGQQHSIATVCRVYDSYKKCPTFCPSVISRYWVETNEHRIMRFYCWVPVKVLFLRQIWLSHCFGDVATKRSESYGYSPFLTFYPSHTCDLAYDSWCQKTRIP